MKTISFVFKVIYFLLFSVPLFISFMIALEVYYFIRNKQL